MSARRKTRLLVPVIAFALAGAAASAVASDDMAGVSSDKAKKRSRMRVIYAQMVTDFLSESEDWGRADDLLAPLTAVEPGKNGRPTSNPGSASPASVAACHATIADDAVDARNETLTLTYLRGLRALATGDAGAADAAATALGKLSRATAATERDFWQMAEFEIVGRAAGLRRDSKTAASKLKAAIELDERRPPLGPVQGVTPRERLADALLATGRPTEALQDYRRVLDLHPRRARALYGAARAATAARDSAASSYWTELAAVWSKADPDIPEVAELHRSLGR